MPLTGSTAFPLASDAMMLARSLLNDADIPTIQPITPTGLVRASNQVTLTTSAPHGFQIGDVISIANTLDASFEGTFTLLTIPTSTTMTYAQFVVDSTSGTGTASLIVQGDVFTDDVLLPFVNKAYRKVQSRLLDDGSKTATTTAELLNIPAGTTRLDDASFPQLPVDFFAPRRLWERISGQPYYSPMAPNDIIPSMPQQSYNRIWSWENEGINLLGSLNDTDIKLRYFKATLNDLSGPQGTILIRGGLDAVADGTAYFAANARNALNAAVFKNTFEESVKELLSMQTHSRQYLPGRRKPYNRRIGTSFWNYGNTI